MILAMLLLETVSLLSKLVLESMLAILNLVTSLLVLAKYNLKYVTMETHVPPILAILPMEPANLPLSLAHTLISAILNPAAPTMEHVLSLQSIATMEIHALSILAILPLDNAAIPLLYAPLQMLVTQLLAMWPMDNVL